LFKQGPKLIQRRKRPRKQLVCELLEDRLTPTTYTWTGLGASSDWSVAANWSSSAGGSAAPSTAPGAVNDLVFGVIKPTASLPTTNNLSGLIVDSITFSADTPKGPGYNLGGNAITLTGGITVGASLGTTTIALNTTLTPSTPTLQQTFLVNPASTLDISGTLTGSEPAANGQTATYETASETLNKSGTGTLQLDGANKGFTGGIDINTGIVAITNSNALGLGPVPADSSIPTAGTTTINTNAQLQLLGTASGLSVPENLVINGSGIVTDGALLNATGTNNVWTGTIKMTTDSSIGANANTTLSINGVITDTGSGHSITKVGKGTVVFSRVGGNTYRGKTIINNGILEIEDPLSLGAGATSSSSLSGSPQAETIVNYDATTGVAGTLQLNFPGTLGANDPNGVLKNPALAYNATTNPYIGFQVFNDIVVLNGPGFSGLGALDNAVGDNTWDGSVVLGSPSGVPLTGDVTIEVPAASKAQPYTDLTISGVVSSYTPLSNPVSNLIKIGGGNLVLNNANTFTGNTYIEQGAISIADSSALGSATTNNVYVGYSPGINFTNSAASLQLEVDSGLDGTSAAGVPEMTHYRNLGFDSVNGTGTAQEVDVTGTTGSFTLTLTSYSVTGLVSNYTTVPVNVTSSTFISDLTSAVTTMLNNYLSNADPSVSATGNVVVTEDVAGSGTGNLYRIAFTGPLANVDLPLFTAAATSPPATPLSVAVNSTYGLTISNPLYMTGQGLNPSAGVNTGALNSISGINTYVGPITMTYVGGIPLPAGGTSSFGVGADTRPGHNLGDANYLAYDWSLTILGDGTTSGIVGGISANTMYKYGQGDLILPTANNYTSPNVITAGWVTVENNQSLGVQQNLTQTLQSYTTVDSNAAVMLYAPNAAQGQFLTLANNFVLSGDGIAPGTMNNVTTPNVYGLINSEGAIENLNGDNLLTGIIQLNGNAGIGVEQVFPPPVSAAPQAATPTSQLTLAGPLWNFPGATGGLTKLGSRRLIIAGPGTYTGNVNISQGVLLLQNNTGLGQGNSTSPPTTTVASGAALELGNTVTALDVSNNLGGDTYTSSESGGLLEGLTVQGIKLVLNGSGDPTFGDTPLTILSSNAPTTGPEVQTIAVGPSGSFTLTYGGQTTAPFTIGATTGAGASTPAAIQQALDALTSISNFAGAYATVNQNGNVYSITIVNPLAVIQDQAVTANSYVPVGTGNPGDAVATLIENTSTSEPLAPQNDPLVSTDNFWNGPVALNSNTTITAPTNSRLVVGGTISDGTNTPSNGYGGSSLTFVGGGELDLDGTNTYSGTTYINQGVLTAGSNSALGAPGVPEVQTIKITGAKAGSTQFVLTFTNDSGVVEPAAAITYSGNATTDATNIQKALNALPNISGTGDTGGSVSVSEQITAAGVTITVTFGGTLSGFPQKLLGATILNGPGAIAASPLTPTTTGGGGTIVANGASLQLAGSVTIAGEPLIVQGNGSLVDTQSLTVSATSGDYDLSLTAPDSSGSTVTDTAVLSYLSDATDIKTALNNLGNIGGVGGSVTVNLEQVQDLGVPTGATGTFTLSYTGPDATGATVTETTPALNLSSLTLANDIQTALNGLSNIGGVGGVVAVTQSSTGVYQIAFGGSLAGQNPALMSVNNTNVTGPSLGVSVDTSEQVFSIAFGGSLTGKALQTLSATSDLGVPLTGTVNTVTTQVGASALETIPTQWFPVGPAPITGGQTIGNSNVAGSVTAIAVDPSDPNTIYIATNGGGVWKTQNGGANWYPIFDSIPEIQTVTVNEIPGHTFTLSFTAQTQLGPVTDTTTSLSDTDPNLALDMQNALNALGNIGGAGGLVTVFQSAATGQSMTFEVTFGGSLAGYTEQLLAANPVDAMGNASTSDVTTAELEAGASTNFALYVGAIAINPNNPNVVYVGTGVANNSSDSFYGTGIYESENAGVTWTLMQNNTLQNNSAAANPFIGRVISAMTVDPQTNDLLVSDGDSTPGQDTVETLTLIGVNSFTISLTAPDSTGAVVTDTTPNINVGALFTDPISGITYGGYPSTADQIQYYMNQFSNIGGVGGFVTVPQTPPTGPGGGQLFNTFNITFQGALSYTTEPALVTDFLLPDQAAPPVIGVQVSAVAGPTTDVNGTVGGSGTAVGIWEFQPAFSNDPTNPAGTWNDLTGITSYTRANLASPNAADPIYGPGGIVPAGVPNNPGPDDDYQVYFPKSNATWSDLQIVTNSLGQEILLAALGSSSIGTNNSLNAQGQIIGTPADGVYWTTSFDGPLSQITWYQGNVFAGVIPSEIYTPDNEAASMFPSPFYVGNSSGQQPENGNIKLSAVTGGSPSNEPGAFGLPLPGGGFLPVSYNVGFATIYASVSTAGGALQGIYVSTDGGVDWAAVGSLPGSDYLAGQGQYDNAILAVNQNTVYVGGSIGSGSVPGQTGQIWETTNGGASWTDESVLKGAGPHDSQHALVSDDGQGILSGNDGGIWLLNTVNNEQTPQTWTDINGDLQTAEINSIAVDPASIAGIPSNTLSVTTVAGVANNGTAGFSNGQTWGELDASAGSEMTTTQVFIDPSNPNIIYEAQSQLNGGTGALIRESSDDGQTWTTILQNPAGFTPATPNDLMSAVAPLEMDQINPERLVVGGGQDNGLYEALDGSSGAPNWINVGAALPINVTAIGLAEYQGVFQYQSQYPAVADQGADTYVPKTFYVTNGSQVYVTFDDGSTWVNTNTLPAALNTSTTSLPSGYNIEQLVVDPRNSYTLYAVINGPNQTNLANPPQTLGGGLYVSYDAGANWTPIGYANGLPNTPVWSLVIDPRNDNLYVGTDIGVFELVGGANIPNASGTANPPSGTWQPFGIGLPVAQVHSLVLNQTSNTLLAGTYGRGVYELFLDNAETVNTTMPVSTSAVTGLAGPTVWTGPLVLEGNTSVGADGALNLPNGISSGSIEFVGQISDIVSGVSTTNDPTIDKVGFGNVIFAGTNVYGGVTDILQGNLIADSQGALGANSQGAADGTIVEQGAALELESNLGSETVTLNGDGSSFEDHYTGALRNISGNNIFTGNVILGANDPNATITIGADSGSVLTMTGAISDAAGASSALVKEGTGTIALDNASPNTYAGTTYVYQGGLQAETSTSFGPSTNSVVVLDGAQVQLQTPTGGPAVSISNPLTMSGTGIFGTGALLNIGGANTWLGDILFALLPGFSRETFPLSDVSIGVDAGSTLTIGGTIGELQENGEVAYPNQQPAHKTVGQESNLNKVGGGALVLENSGTFTGGVTVTSGDLIVANSNALGQHPTVDPNLGTVQQVVVLGNNPQGEFQLSFDGQTTTMSEGISAEAMETRLNRPGGLFANSGVIVVSTPIETTTQNNPTADVSDGVLYTITLQGSLQDTTAALTATGSNGIVAAASFVTTGGDDVLVDTGAELDLNANAEATSPGTNLVVAGHTITLNGSGETGNGALQNTGGDNSWVPANGLGGIIVQTGPTASGTTSTNPTLNSSIGAASGTSLSVDVPVTITVPAGTLSAPALTIGGAGLGGAGTVVFEAGTTQPLTSNNLKVPTLITGGDVESDGTLGNIELAGGAVSGVGTVGAILDAGVSGGIVNPGQNGDSTLLNSTNQYPVEGQNANTVGTLTSGNVTLSKNDVYDTYVGDPNIANSSTLLQVNGSLAINGATLSGYVSPAVAIGSAPTIIINTTGGVTGTFSGPTTTPSLAGASKATISFVDNEKFEVDYFPSYVEVLRVAETVTLGALMVQTPAGAPVNPVYGEDVKVYFTLTPESSQVNLAGSTVIFQIVDNNTGSTYRFPATIPAVASGSTYTATIDVPESLGYPLSVGSADYTVSAYYDGQLSDGAVLFTPVSDGIVTGYNSTQQNPALNISVAPANTTTTLTLSNSGSKFTYGVPLTFTATVAGTLPANDMPTGLSQPILPPEGTVAFYDTVNNQQQLLGYGALTTTNGVTTATFVSSSLGQGNHSITAVYQGNGTPPNYNGSNSNAAPINIVVLPAQSTMTLTASPPTINYNGSVTLVATVIPPVGNQGLPTGSVLFTDATTGQTLGSATLYTSNGVTTATFTTQPFQIPADNAATQTIVASYQGDGDFAPSSAQTTLTVDPIGTTTTVTTTLSPQTAPAGQSLTFTASVFPVVTGSGEANPTGTVTFQFYVRNTDGTNGALVLQGSGTVATSFGLTSTSFTTNQLTAGSYNVTATYNGDGNFTSSSGGLSSALTITTATTSTTLTAAPSTAVENLGVTFTATVTTPSGGVPFGAVSFLDLTTNKQLGSAMLDANGQATIVAALGAPLNTHTIEAVFAPNNSSTSFSTSSGETTVKVVANGTRASKIGLTSSANPSQNGQAVTFTATITDAGTGAAQTPTGTVEFTNTTTIGGTATTTVLGYGFLTATGARTAVATLTSAALTPGTTNVITAVYSGSQLFAVEKTTLNQVVTLGLSSSVGLSSSANPSYYAKPVAFTATVANNSTTPGVTPTGTVTFTFTNTTTHTTFTGTGTLSTKAGVTTATFTPTSAQLVPGSYTVTATYSGDSNFASGVQATLNQTVNQDVSTVTLTGSTSTVYGQAATYTAVVANSTVPTVRPTGTVTFGYMSGGALVPLGTANLVTKSGKVYATFSTKSFGPNSYQIVAQYNGNADVQSGTSGVVYLTVNPDAARIVLTASTSNSNSNVTFTATVQAAAPGAGTPTGTVTFYINGSPQGTGTLNSKGQATLNLPAGLPNGNYTVEAVYSGDNDFDTTQTTKVFDFTVGRGT
jgi:autotransporter-associated beta strand protein